MVLNAFVKRVYLRVHLLKKIVIFKNQFRGVKILRAKIEKNLEDKDTT
jgi:Holliday junction resolvase